MARNLDVPVYEDVKTWKPDKVSDWLHQIGFYEFVDGFESKSIDGKRMLSLSEDELRRCYPNMRGGRSDPTADLMRQIQKVKNNKRKGFLLGRLGVSKRNEAPVPRRDYPTNGHSQHHISQDDEEQWPEDEFDDAGDEYDDPTPEPQPNHPRSSSYHGSTGTTASSTTTADSDQLYMDPAADEDYGGTYEVPGQNPNMAVEEEDFDQTYDVVPHEEEEDIRRPPPAHRPPLQTPTSQMHGRSPSPSRRNLQPPPPRPAKSDNLRSPAQRDLPNVPPQSQRSPRHLPPTGGARLPPRPHQRPTNGFNNQRSDSEDDEEYLVPNEQGELYEVADRNEPQSQPQSSHLAPPHEERRKSQQRLSQQSLPPPPDEQELYIVPNEEEHGNTEDDVYVVPSEDQDQGDLYLAPSENQDEGGQDSGELYIDPMEENQGGDDFYLDPNEDPSNRQIQSRQLPAVPPSPSGRPPMPTPPHAHDPPGMPRRPPKPTELKNANSNVLAPPAIPTRPPIKSPLKSNIPMPRVLPNPSMSSLNNHQRSKSEEPQSSLGQNRESLDVDGENPKERKSSAGTVSDLRQRFNNNNSDKTISPRPGSRPNVASRHLSSQPTPSVQVPDLPSRRPPPATIPTPYLPTRPPVSPEPDRPPSTRRWPPVDTTANKVTPPPIPRPVAKPPEVKPPEPARPAKPIPQPELPAPSPRENKYPSPKPRPQPQTHEPMIIQPQQPKPPVPQQPSQPPPSPSPRHPPAAPKPNELEGYPWYQGSLKRDKAFAAVKENGQDGAFLVRNSEKGGEDAPYSLTLWYNNKVRNLKIRQRKDGKFALGNFKDNEVAHDSASQMIQYYQQEPVILAKDEGKVILKIAVPIY